MGGPGSNLGWMWSNYIIWNSPIINLKLNKTYCSLGDIINFPGITKFLKLNYWADKLVIKFGRCILSSGGQDLKKMILTKGN